MMIEKKEEGSDSVHVRFHKFCDLGGTPTDFDIFSKNTYNLLDNQIIQALSTPPHYIVKGKSSWAKPL